MTYRVKILDFLTAFNNAHKELIDKRKPATRLIAQEQWQEEYRSVVINQPGQNQWQYIEFTSEEAYTMFMLRWL